MFIPTGNTPSRESAPSSTHIGQGSEATQHAEKIDSLLQKLHLLEQSENELNKIKNPNAPGVFSQLNPILIRHGIASTQISSVFKTGYEETKKFVRDAIEQTKSELSALTSHSLPTDVITEILRHTDPKTRAAAASVSREFAQSSADATRLDESLKMKETLEQLIEEVKKGAPKGSRDAQEAIDHLTSLLQSDIFQDTTSFASIENRRKEIQKLVSIELEKLMPKQLKELATSFKDIFTSQNASSGQKLLAVAIDIARIHQVLAETRMREDWNPFEHMPEFIEAFPPVQGENLEKIPFLQETAQEVRAVFERNPEQFAQHKDEFLTAFGHFFPAEAAPLAARMAEQHVYHPPLLIASVLSGNLNLAIRYLHPHFLENRDEDTRIWLENKLIEDTIAQGHFREFLATLKKNLSAYPQYDVDMIFHEITICAYTRKHFSEAKTAATYVVDKSTSQFLQNRISMLESAPQEKDLDQVAQLISKKEYDNALALTAKKSWFFNRKPQMEKTRVMIIHEAVKNQDFARAKKEIEQLSTPEKKLPIEIAEAFLKHGHEEYVLQFAMKIKEPTVRDALLDSLCIACIQNDKFHTALNAIDKIPDIETRNKLYTKLSEAISHKNLIEIRKFLAGITIVDSPNFKVAFAKGLINTLITMENPPKDSGTKAYALLHDIPPEPSFIQDCIQNMYEKKLWKEAAQVAKEFKNIPLLEQLMKENEASFSEESIQARAVIDQTLGIFPGFKPFYDSRA